MKRYDKITIIRNRHRARDLRRFRDLVEAYFERVAVDRDGLPVDPRGAQAARARINRMLPRVIQVVQAAGLGASGGATTDPGLALGDVEVLRNIFSHRYADGGEQEILDVIDLALGVYEESVLYSLLRTVNPLHYVGTALAFVAGLPRRMFAALGLWPRRARVRIGPGDVQRLEAAAARFADVEELIEARFAELRDLQMRQSATNAGQLEDIAERLDFAERMLAQRRPIGRLESPDENDVVTPV